MAESTPVSSVMRASTCTWLPRALARTSEICGGLVSSALAARAKQSAAIPEASGVRMPGDYPRRARINRARAARRRLRRGRRALRGELHRDDLRDARLLHGDAVERVGDLHGALVVRDDDELGGAAHLPDHLVVPADVRLVERRVDLVEQAERRRLDQEDGEDQRDRGERLLPAGEQVDGDQ